MMECSLDDIGGVAAMLGMQVAPHVFRPLPHVPQHVMTGLVLWAADVIYYARTLDEARGFLADRFRRLVLDPRGIGGEGQQ